MNSHVLFGNWSLNRLYLGEILLDRVRGEISDKNRVVAGIY